MLMWIKVVSLVGALFSFVWGKNQTEIKIAIFISIAVFAINITVGNICEVIRRTCRPDTIYYHRTVDLIKTRIFWNIGIHVSGIFLSSCFVTAFLIELKSNWLILGVIILGGFMALITTPTIVEK